MVSWLSPGFLGRRSLRGVNSKMAQIEVNPEDDVFEGIKGRAIAKVKEVLADSYAQDPEDLRSDLADVLDVEDEGDLPKFEVDVILRIGKQTIAVSGLTVEEKDDE